MVTLLATQGVDPGDRSVPLGVAQFLARMMEWMWRTFRLKGEPPLTRLMLRFVGYDFTVSDRRAHEELGYPTNAASAALKENVARLEQGYWMKPDALPKSYFGQLGHDRCLTCY